MTPQQIDEAARILFEARRNRRIIPGLPQPLKPTTVSVAYAIQDRLFGMIGKPSGGWFAGCTNGLVQRKLGLDGPYGARLIAETIHASPARLDPARFPTITLECEFAFRLARDLPARASPYSRAEVEAAILTVHPAIEVVTSILEDWTNQDIGTLIADNGTDGALVTGIGVRYEPGMDLRETAVGLVLNGRRAAEGTGREVLGDPLDAFCWLVNHARERGEGMRADDVHNTGTATPMVQAAAGDHAVARFSGLGEVEIRFIA